MNSKLNQNHLDRINQLLKTYPSLMDAYHKLEPFVLGLFNSERMSIFQRRRQHQDLVARFKTGKETREIKVPISPMSIAGYVALSQLPLIIDDPYNKEELASIHKRLNFADRFDKDSTFITRNIICIPILDSDVLMGVMQIINKKDAVFSDDDLALANAIAEIIGKKFRYELGGTSQPFDYLVHRNLITEKELKKLQETSHDNRQLVQRLTSEHRIPENDLGNALSVHFQVPYIDYLPDKYHLFQSDSKLNLSYLKRNFVAVLADVKDNPIVLMAEPNNATLLMEIERALGIDSYEISVSLPNTILQYLGEAAGGGSGPGAMDEILDEIGTNSDEIDIQSDEMSDDAPAVVRLVSRVLHDAKRLNASDIHIDPEKNAPTRVRMRIDGVCRDVTQVPASHHSAVIARIKIMSNLNIAEKRVPQDGKLSFRMSGQLIEVRVATIPTIAGEGVVMRILAAGGAMPMSKLNLSPRNHEKTLELVQKPHDIILVVGPTGSGKTTTLHAVLGHINTPEKKIWTAEDPVEITQPGLQQVQVSAKIGFTFANALRAFLRADPDIILIGEMRDKETVEIGLRGALTGHLVLSTLHTNDSISSAIRLLDMGAPGYLVASSLRGIIAQRLVRRICDNCSVDEKVSSEANFWLKTLNEDISNITFKKGAGCQKCNHSGYRGRVGVFELLEMTEAMMNSLKNEDTSAFSEAARLSPEYKPLAHSALLYAKEGITTIEELLQLVEMGGDAK